MTAITASSQLADNPRPVSSNAPISADSPDLRPSLRDDARDADDAQKGPKMTKKSHLRGQAFRETVSIARHRHKNLRNPDEMVAVKLVQHDVTAAAQVLLPPLRDESDKADRL